MPRHRRERAALLAPGFAARPRPPTEEFRPGSITVERPDPRRLDVRVEDSSGGWLVVHEGWAPGWRATVDGADVPVARVDHAFRGVPIPAGSSTVRMRYAPRSHALGAWLSLFALAAAALLDRRLARLG